MECFIRFQVKQTQSLNEKLKLLTRACLHVAAADMHEVTVSVFLLVIKRKNVVQLHVDTVDNYKIGPPSSTITLTKDPLYVGGIPGECSSVLD